MAIDWSLEELQTALEEITSGERLVEVSNKEGESIFIVFRYPSRTDVRNSDIKMKQKTSYLQKDMKIYS